MIECKRVCLWLLVGGLLLFSVPIKINKPKADNSKLLFHSYLRKYNKTLIDGTAEYDRRFENFQESLALIKNLNSLRDNSSDAAIYGLTEYADISQEEFIKKHLHKGYIKRLMKHKKHKLQEGFKHRNKHHKRSLSKLPESLDWRTKGVVTAVKNQKSCGACWAFSVIETVESMAAIKYEKLQALSVQQAIDCATNGNFGCNGGDTCSLLEWLVDNNIKVELEKDYPLVLQTETCKLNKLAYGVQVASNFSCDSFIGNEDILLATLAYHGPVAVAVNALLWQFYLGGVIKYHCDSNSINHAVQIVGYDTNAPTPHYIVRNSWGTSFGEKGYLKIAIGENICGLATEVSALDVL